MRSRPLSTREEKVAWLLARQNLWEGMPTNIRDTSQDRVHWERLAELRRMMKEARLYSEKTYDRDVEYSISVLIQQARTVRKGEGR